MRFGTEIVVDVIQTHKTANYIFSNGPLFPPTDSAEDEFLAHIFS